MKLVVDSEAVELPNPDTQSFQAYCGSVMTWLMNQDKAIASCKLDGKPIETVAEAEEVFPHSQTMEVETMPAHEAISNAIAMHITRMRKLEEGCETLVTDCLLADPMDIAQQWQDLCADLMQAIDFYPRYAHLLSAEEVEALTDGDYAALKDLMNEIGEVLPKADVVTFSDILEMKLNPWLKKMREVSEKMLHNFESSRKS